ncbi:c-type cytochrome [Azohydromonas caseinilytica]|uniref:Cytochrome c n=1 Tax=Azohydromonas caseinilytica TaxID=2728836 RepID=A0A848F952_9BURK|nr:cytochrome c [Azohydromonas caseinilytica]NML15235.1 cytochrome c [Azohydromonas caseinilytica]
MKPLLSALALALACAGAPAQEAAPQPGAARQAQLLRLLRQDCGSCHGMRLTGGLGPALTRQALAQIPPDSLAATIFHGRPGTPMPGWSSFMSAEEAQWLAQRLRAGVPEESR